MAVRHGLLVPASHQGDLTRVGLAYGQEYLIHDRHGLIPWHSCLLQLFHEAVRIERPVPLPRLVRVCRWRRNGSTS